MNVGTAQVFRVAAPDCPATGALSIASDENLIPVKYGHRSEYGAEMPHVLQASPPLAYG